MSSRFSVGSPQISGSMVARSLFFVHWNGRHFTQGAQIKRDLSSKWRWRAAANILFPVHVHILKDMLIEVHKGARPYASAMHTRNIFLWYSVQGLSHQETAGMEQKYPPHNLRYPVMLMFIPSYKLVIHFSYSLYNHLTELLGTQYLSKMLYQYYFSHPFPTLSQTHFLSERYRFRVVFDACHLGV